MPRDSGNALASSVMHTPRPAGRHVELEIEEDLAFHERVRRVQRVGWAVIMVVILAGLGGLFGRGPLSDAESRVDPAGLRVNYSRFTRVDAPDVLRVWTPAAPDGEGFVLLLNRAYLDRVRVDTVMPSPAAVEVGEERVRYVFARRSGEVGAWVTFHLTPQSTGLARARVGMPGAADVAIWQFVYP
jgi:hypothetical protein